MRKLISTTYKYQRGRRERGLSKGKEREGVLKGRGRGKRERIIKGDGKRERESSRFQQEFTIFIIPPHKQSLEGI